MSATYLSPAEQKVAALDLSAVMAKVVAEHDMDAATAARAEELYRQFLVLKAENMATTLVPPRLADLVWHEHITHTRKYMADCQAVFGEYLHHTPGLVEYDAYYQARYIQNLPLWQNRFRTDLASHAHSGCDA